MTRGLLQWIVGRSTWEYHRPTQLYFRQIVKQSSWPPCVFIGKRWVFLGEVVPVPQGVKVHVRKAGSSPLPFSLLFSV